MMNGCGRARPSRTSFFPGNPSRATGTPLVIASPHGLAGDAHRTPVGVSTAFLSPARLP
jgi:hypothetical protein